MKDNFLNYPQSLAVKELGFNEPCFAIHNTYTKDFCYNQYPSNFSSQDCVPAPLKNQFLNWVRNNYNIFPTLFQVRAWSTVFKIIEWNPSCDSTMLTDSISFEKFEDAEDALINKIIEILKQKKNDNK